MRFAKLVEERPLKSALTVRFTAGCRLEHIRQIGRSLLV